MSTAQNDQLFTNGENYGQINLQNKQMHSERKHTVRKHALGEIKNVFHNQASITPFKGLQAGTSRSFCADLLKKQSENLNSQVSNRQKVNQSQKIQSSSINKLEDLEKINFPAPKTCTASCHKGLDEIWSEMNVLEPDVLERIINGDSDALNEEDIFEPYQLPNEFENQLDPPFNLQDPYESNEKQLLQNLLVEDHSYFDIPKALDWFDEL